MILALQLIGGAALLLLGGEALVRGAVQIATRFGLSRLVVGMVIAGFGTSLPELVISVRSVMADAPGLAAGNVVGSNISNILLILGVAALIRPIDAPYRHLEPDAVVLLLVTIGFVLLGLQGTVPQWQGGAMVLLLIVLVVVKIRMDRKAELRRQATEDVVETLAPIPGPAWPAFAFVLAGMAALPAGGELFVQGAITLAELMNVPNALIGLSIVAIGTSLPELATSAIAALKGESTVGYGNIVGSNMFNLLGIFGCATLAGEMRVPLVMVYADGLVMIGATIVMMFFLATHARLTRGEAAIMLLAYVAYIGARYMFELS